MANTNLGKVVEVSNTSIRVAVDKNIKTSFLIINSESIRIGGVGNFVKVGNDIYEIINEKTNIDLDKNIENNKVSSNKIISCQVIGYFKEGCFKEGSSGNTPNVFDNVYTIADKELMQIYSGTDFNNAIDIGRYMYKQDISFYLDVNKFFASHALIVGNTGSGKSNTVNCIYSELFNKIKTNGSYFLFIDTNGEYGEAFTKAKIVKKLNTRSPKENTIEIPLNLLNAEDWKLLLEATEKTQYPIIKSVWNGIEKNIFKTSNDMSITHHIIKELKKSFLGILNSNSSAGNKLGAINTIKEDCSYLKDDFYSNLQDFFDIFNNVVVNGNKFIYQNSGDVYYDVTFDIIIKITNYENHTAKNSFSIEDLGLLLNLNHLYRTYKYNINESNTSPLIGRFNTNKRDFSNIFTPFQIGKEPNIIESLFGKSTILVCDVSSARKDIRRLMVSFLCAKSYSHFCSNPTENLSLQLIVDEAHNYLSSQNIDKEDAIAKTCIETFESIIKEGRKFGVFLTMATQRPSDITQTLLSQAHNYIIHKLVNPRDIEIIRNTVPFIDEMNMKMISILSPGQAIFSGTAFNRPSLIEVKFDECGNTKVNSQTVKLMNYWRKF